MTEKTPTELLEEIRQILLEMADGYCDTGLFVDRDHSRIDLQVDSELLGDYRKAILEILLETATEYTDCGFQVDVRNRIIQYDSGPQLKLEVSADGKQIDLKIIDS